MGWQSRLRAARKAVRAQGRIFTDDDKRNVPKRGYRRQRGAAPIVPFRLKQPKQPKQVTVADIEKRFKERKQ